MRATAGEVINFVNKNKRRFNKNFTVVTKHNHEGCQEGVVTKFAEVGKDSLDPVSNTIVEKSAAYVKFLKGFSSDAVMMNHCPTCGKVYYVDSYEVNDEGALVLSGEEVKED